MSAGSLESQRPVGPHAAPGLGGGGVGEAMALSSQAVPRGMREPASWRSFLCGWDARRLYGLQSLHGVARLSDRVGTSIWNLV